MRNLYLFFIIIFYFKANAQTITTIIGTGYGSGTGIGNYSGDGGPANVCNMHGPRGIVFDKKGNLFIAEDANGTIRVVNTGDTINKFAGRPLFSGNYYCGDGGNKDTTLMYPGGLAFDSIGNLYYTDESYNLIRKIDSLGKVTTYAGNYYKSYAYALSAAGYGGDNGRADSAILFGPTDITFDKSGNLFIADAQNNLIRKINASGIITTVAGDTTGASSSSCFGSCNAGYSGDGGPATKAKLYSPIGITVDAIGNLYIADTYNNLIRKVDVMGKITTIAGDTNGAYSGANAGYIGDGGLATSAKLNWPSKVCFDSFGNMYIAELTNNTIRKVNASGIISTYVGTGGAGYTGDHGPATLATLNQPFDIFFDALDNLYISDWYNNVIRKVSSPYSGMKTFSEPNGINAFPNPANNTLIISSSNEFGIITINNSLGEIVLQTKSKNKQEQIDISRLSSGIYILQTQNERIKFVKE
ncbi:MAG: NHL domain-containing protein [Bacteroidia bacterium]